MLKISTPETIFIIHAFPAVLSIISVYFGFRGVRWLAILSNPFIVGLLVIIMIAYFQAKGGLSLSHPLIYTSANVSENAL